MHFSVRGCYNQILPLLSLLHHLHYYPLHPPFLPLHHHYHHHHFLHPTQVDHQSQILFLSLRFLRSLGNPGQIIMKRCGGGLAVYFNGGCGPIFTGSLWASLDPDEKFSHTSTTTPLVADTSTIYFLSHRQPSQYYKMLPTRTPLYTHYWILKCCITTV